MSVNLPGLDESNQLRQNSSIRQIAQDLKTNYAPLVSPAFTTPSLGVATATSINGLTITSTTGTLTIAAGKTLTISNTVTLTGTDGSTLNFGTGGTLGSLAYLSAAPAGTLTGTTLAANVVTSSLTAVGTLATGVWNATAVGVAYGGTGQTTYTDGQLLIGNSSGNTLTKATLTAGSNISITNGNGSITIAATGGNWTLIKKTADQSTSSTSFADDTILQFAVAANKCYKFRGALIVNLGAGGMKVAVNGPASPTSLRVNAATGTVQTAYDTAFFSSASSGIVIAFPFEGKLDNAANAGTLAIRIGLNSASGTTTFEKGCYLEWMEVA